MPGSRRTQARVEEIIRRLAKAHPDAKLDLDFSSPLELLVALILAAQCTDKKVNEVTPDLFRRYRTAHELATAKPDELEAAVRPTGFFRQKARTIRACCGAMVERFQGEAPSRLEDLVTLPGVGRKTANILLGNAFGIPGIGVDTHVARLASRIGLSRQQDPDRIERDLTATIPPAEQVRFCHLLQYHGRRVCKARKPACAGCPIADLCDYPRQETARETATGPSLSTK